MKTELERTTDRWHVDRQANGRATIKDQNGLFVAEVIEADANLVVTAPELLDALLAIRDELWPPTNPQAEWTCDTVVKIDSIVQECLKLVQEEK